MADNPLFRKSALDKLASPERLDVLMQVTSPQGWIALWTVGVVLAAVVGWSIFGSLGERVNGQGLLIRGEANRLILAGGSGTIQSLRVSSGDLVKEGQLVAEIAGATQSEEAATANQALETAQNEYDRRRSELAQEQLQVRAQLADVSAQLDTAQGDLGNLQRRSAERKEALSKQLISQNTYDAFVQQLRAADNRVRSLTEQQRALRARLASIPNDLSRAEDRLASAQQNYNLVTTGMGAASTVISRFSGRIVNLPKRQGDAVKQGEIIAVLEEESEPLNAAMAVSAAEGPRIRPGMQVQLDLSPVVQREQYGVLLGHVSSVGSFAAMQSEVLAIFGEAQGRELMQTGRFLVRVELERNPSTPTGFAWSSSSGPSQPINSGISVANGAIIVDSRRPICRVLPIHLLCG